MQLLWQIRLNIKAQGLKIILYYKNMKMHFSLKHQGNLPKEIDFTIDLVLGVALVSKVPYKMSTLEWVELIM